MGNVTIKINVGLNRDPTSTIVTPTMDALREVRAGARRELGGMSAEQKQLVESDLRHLRQTWKRRQREQTEAAREAARAKKDEDRKGLRAQKDADAEAERAKKASAKKQKEIDRELARDEREQHNEQLRMLREQNRERIRLYREENRERERLDDEKISNARRAAEKLQRIRAGNTQKLDRMMMSGAGMAWGLAKRGAGMAMSGLASAAGAFGVDADLGSAMGKAVDLEAQSVALANQAYRTGGKGAVGMHQDPEVLQREARDVASRTGYAAGDVMSGLTKFVEKTGDLRTARNVMLELATLSRATNTEFADMIDAAANVSLELGNVEDKEKAVLDVMRGVTAQGKMGAVEIKDLSRQMAKVAAAAGQFGGDRAGNVLTMAAFAQEARAMGGAASATQAATSVMSFAAQFRKGKRVAEMERILGRKIRDANGNLGSPEGDLFEIISKTRGDTLKMSAAFADQQAQRVTLPFAQIYRDAYAGATGDDKARDQAATRAVRIEFEKLQKATLNEVEMARAFSAAMATGKTKADLFNIEMEKVGKQLKDKLEGPLEKLAPYALKLADSFADMVDMVLRAMHIDSHEGERRVVATGVQATSDMATIYNQLEKDVGVAPSVAKLRGGPSGVGIPLLEAPGFGAIPYPEGRYDAEHVGAAKDKLKEVTETIRTVKAALEKADEVERQDPTVRHMVKDPFTGKEYPAPEWTDANFKPHPTYEGYETKEDYDRIQEIAANRVKLAALEGNYAELSTFIQWMDGAKKGQALRVWIENKDGTENKPSDVDSTDEGTTSSAKGPDNMSHGP